MANDLTPYIAKHWAMESVAVLFENAQMVRTVHTDFNATFAKHGDTVNTRKPRDFEGKRKHKGDNIVTSDAVSDNIPVVLNQHIYESFFLDDEDLTKSFKDLKAEFLDPAAKALARKVDRLLLGQVYQFLHYQAGGLGLMTKTNAVDYLTGVRQVLNQNLVPDDDDLRYLGVGTRADMLLLQNDIFSAADKSGTTEGLIRGTLGRKFNLGLWMGQNVPSLYADVSLGTGAINSAAGYPVGATVLTVDGFAMGELVVADAGRWITINGRPYHLTAVNADPATQLTLEYGLTAAVADNDVILVYDRGAVNNASGYAAGWTKEIAIDGVSGGNLQVGQMVTFGTTNHRYAVIKTNGTTSMELDRPLEASIADNDTVNFGPSGGDFNFAYHRNAITCALRPLVPVSQGTGALSSTVSFNGIPMRLTISYDDSRQAQKCTLDFLAGVKVLDGKLGAAMLA